MDARRVVLVVEDDGEFRRMLTRVLEDSGLRVEEAADGEACLARLLHANPPDFVICDVRMPGMGGLEIFERLRARNLSVPPFVLITGFGDAHVHEQGARLGAAATIDKPFDLDELQKLVRLHLSERSL